MLQKSVSFHTSKSFPQSLEILKKARLEILFHAEGIHFDFMELTVEEQISWLQTREKFLRRSDEFLKKHSGNFENLFDSLKDLRKQTKELIKLYRSRPLNYQTSEKYEQFNKARQQLMKKYDYEPLYDLLSHHFRDGLSVYCSCIIAKKGNNLVRYLSFKRDPIITIQGPESRAMKAILTTRF